MASSLITMDVVRDCSPSRPKLTKHSDRHPRLVLEQINQFRQQSSASTNTGIQQDLAGNDLCDVVLVVGESRIRAHKIILSASSPYFRAMFTNDLLAESKQSEIVIRDIDEQAMEMLVDFCYSSKITIDEKTVQTLLPASCLLQIHEVQDYCSEFLRSQLDPSNCLGIRAFADTHSCQELLRLADRYLQNNFVDIVESDEFLMLPVAQLLDIVSKDELNVRGEEQVYMAVMRWLRHDLESRRQYLSQLMTHVRFPLIDTRFLVTRVSTDSLIRQDQATFDLVDEAKNYHLLLKETTQVKNPLHVRSRKPVITGEVLYAVGGWCSGDAISYVEIYDPAASNSSSGTGGGEWQVVASMSKRRCGVGVGVLNNQIYAIGGHDGSTYLNSTERYDPALNQWFNDVTPTSTCRTSVGVGVLDGNLYAVGGQDGVSCLNIVDKYDPINNKWTRVAPMSTRRLGVAVVVYSGYLYAIGGSDGNSPLNSAERYDPKLNKWTLIAPMIVRRKHLACTVYQNLIYAVGGRDDMAELNSAERYDPQANKWELIVSMKSKRSGVGLAVVNGVMMAIGGFDGSNYLKTTEIYDTESNQWRSSNSMNYRRLGGGVGVVTLNRRDESNTSSNSITANKSIDSVSVNSITFQPQRPSLNIGIASSLSPSPVGSTTNTNPASSWQFILTPLPSLLANVPQTSPGPTATSSITNNRIISPSTGQETSSSSLAPNNSDDNTQQASMTSNLASEQTPNSVELGGISMVSGGNLTDLHYNNSSSRSNSISSVLPPTRRPDASTSSSFSPRLLDF